VLGQQVTVSATRLLAGQLVAHHGERVAEARPGLTHVFPTAKNLAAAEFIEIGMPGTRRACLKSLAEAASDPGLFRPFGSIEEAIARLRAIRGVGEWTAQYIALRALRETDAFPAADVGLLRGASFMDGGKFTPADLLARAELWRPWRAYAAQHLWSSSAGAVASDEGVALVKLARAS
jgi:AraC family transcriptional regulator of adaptative response / DNA-3-methyladenine glycosylase II